MELNSVELRASVREAYSRAASNPDERHPFPVGEEFARFCSIARGSASELEYHLLLVRDLNLIKPTDYDELAPRVTELKRMLTGLPQKLNADR